MKLSQADKYFLGASAISYGYFFHKKKFIFITTCYISYKIYKNIDKIKDTYKEAVFEWHERIPWRYHRGFDPNVDLWDLAQSQKKDMKK